MSILKWIPKSIKLKIINTYNKKKYPKRRISNSATIGSNVKLGFPCNINNNVLLSNGVEIGNFSYVNDFTMIGANVKVGSFCSIAYNCQIGMHEHPIQYVSTSPFIYGKKNIFKEPVFWDEFGNNIKIGNDVWIGSNAIVLQGVKIGDGAIIAAGAVVTKDVPQFAIVGGIPAKEIKKRFSVEKIEYLSKLKWWEMSEDELIKYKDFFLAKDEWFEKVK